MTTNLFEEYTTTHGIAENELELTHYAKAYFSHFILPHLPQDKSLPILDIGCGYGKYLLPLQAHGYTCTHGIDVSPEQIHYGQKVKGLDNLEVADALTFLEGKIEKFNIVLLMDVIEHLPLDYSIQLLKKIYVSLKPGGLLVIQTPNALSPLNPLRYGDLTHERAYTPSSMRQTLRLGGFRGGEIYPLPPFCHGIKSITRRFLWSVVLNPLINAYMLVANGCRMEGIFTANLLAIAKK